MVLIIVGGGWYAFEKTLQWSGSDDPIESLADGADRLRDMESAMGEPPEERGRPGSDREPPPGVDMERPEVEDTGPTMDLERLTDKDLRFLQEILDGDDDEARLSAARALVISNHAQAVGMLFGAASQGGEDADLFCLSALDVARMQKKEDTLRELLVAMDQEQLSEDCRAEVGDRFALLGGRDPATMVELYEDSSPEVRAWVARVLADEEGERVDDVLLALVSDPDVSVRSRAWGAWDSRPMDRVLDGLRAAAAGETDADVRAIAQDVLEGG